MESENRVADEQLQPEDGESVEDFKEEMESDPSRAPSEDEDLERARGG